MEKYNVLFKVSLGENFKAVNGPNIYQVEIILDKNTTHVRPIIMETISKHFNTLFVDIIEITRVPISTIDVGNSIQDFLKYKENLSKVIRKFKGN